MSPIAWLRQLFYAPPIEENPGAIPDLEEEEPFVFSQHLRIILAILFTFAAAGIMWWIMA